MARSKSGRHQKSSPKKKTADSERTNSSRLNTTSTSKSSKTKVNGDLKKQIQELGGDEDDYKLLENVDSDIERGGSKAKGGQNDVTLNRDVSKYMKELDFSKLQGNPKKKDKEMKEKKIQEKDQASTIKVKDPANLSKRDRKVSTGQISKTSGKHDKSQLADAAKSESVAKPKHMVFSESGPDIKLRNGGFIPKKKFIVEPSPHWYASASALPLRSMACPPLSPDFLETCQTRAQSLLQADAEMYSASSAHTVSASDARFMSQVLSSGTLSDKLSTLTLMVQASPSHNIRALETLKGMAGKKGREESLKAIRAIVDWWIGGGAPNRKLKYFRDQSLTHPDATDAHIVLWSFEDWLKKYFFSILQILETLANDPLPYVRKQAMYFTFQLLQDKPEQEQNLLRLLVHRLNDFDKSIASKASHHLLQILQLHPKMKKIVVQEIAGFILKPVILNSQATASSTSTQTPTHFTHCRYYAAITFNQIILTSSESDVAELLINIYFEMFKEILGHTEKQIDDDKQDEGRDYRPKKRRGYAGQKAKFSRKPDGTFYTESVNAAESDHNAKLISAVLTGVNRALPFVGDVGKETSFASHINTLFRITHASTITFAVSLQSLMLLLHVCTNPKFSPALSVSPASATSLPPASNTNSLTSLPSRFFRTLYASLFDSRLPHSASSSKHAIYLNLLLKAVKTDSDVKNDTKQTSTHSPKTQKEGKGKRIAEEKPLLVTPGPRRPPARSSALTKRYLQTLASGTGSGGRNEIHCAGLYFIGELMNAVPDLMLLIDGVPSASTQIREAKKEHPSGKAFRKHQPHGSDSEEDHTDVSISETEKNSPSKSNSNVKSLESLGLHSVTQAAVIYDPKKRDPQYANAECSGLWELILLQSHYHPSVSLHAHQLLTHSPVTATPDLGLNTLSHFLDRFVYKNAKTKVTQKGTSAMQRVGNDSQSNPGADTEVNTDKFRKIDEEDVPVDQVFFHKFFTRKHKQETSRGAKAEKRKKKTAKNGEIDEVATSDDEEEQEIWEAMKKSVPELDMGEDDMEDEGEEGEGEEEEEIGDDEEEVGDGSDALEFIEDSDDLISDTGDLKGLVAWTGNENESESGSDNGNENGEGEWKGFGGNVGKGRDAGSGKRDRDDDEGKKKKKRRTGMATFATYEDYMDMIENAQEDNI